jgi:predicted phosphodiesterase
MSTKYTIFSDVHLCGPLAMQVQWEYGPNCVYLGDNVDLTHCRKKDLPAALEMFSFLKDRFKIFCHGNHDHGERGDEQKIHERILFMHGDSVFWNQSKSDSFRCKDYGQGSWLNWLWQHLLDKIFARLPVRFNSLQRWKLEFFSRTSGVDVIVLGHRHVKQVKKIRVTGCDVYIVPRGRTELIL